MKKKNTRLSQTINQDVDDAKTKLNKKFKK